MIKNKSLLKRKSIQQKKTAVSFSMSFDRGEVLPQKRFKPGFQQYVVQSSITDLPFEEYVVSNIPADTAKAIQEPGPDLSAIAPTPTAPKTQDTVSPAPQFEKNIAKLAQEAVPHGPATEAVPAEQAKASESAVASRAASFEYLPAEYSKASSGGDDDDFINDMKAILSGEKKFNESSKRVESKTHQPPPADQAPRASGSLSEMENKHQIFDEIAASMSYAKAYDLGSIDLDQRFQDFDKIEEAKKKTEKSKQAFRPEPSRQMNRETNISQEEFLTDLNNITPTSQQTVIKEQKETARSQAYKYESPSLVMSTEKPRYSYAQNPGVVAGIAVADAIQIGLAGAAIVQSQVSASQGSFSLSYDKAQRLLTNEARIAMPGAQQTKTTYSRKLFWIGELKKGFADATILIEWEGNVYGEIGTAVIRRDIQNSTDWTKSSANTTITKIDRIPLPDTDPRAWPLVYSYEGTFDPAANGKYEYSGEFEINAFGGLKFTRHEVVDRSLIEFMKMGEPEDYVKIGEQFIPPIPAIPEEQLKYLKTKLP